MPAVIRVLVLAVLAALAAGCHFPRESGPARVARLKRSAADLEREEPRALAAIDRKEAAYDARFAERERAIRSCCEERRSEVVGAAARSYHRLLADNRAADPAAQPAMNRRIAAAADAFRDAEARAEREVGPQERASLAKLAAKKRVSDAKFARYRAAIASRFATERRAIEREIAIAEGTRARREF